MDNFILKEIFLSYKKEKNNLIKFLNENELNLDEDVEYAVGIFNEDDELVACGAYSKNVLKCFAVKEEFRGQNILNKIASNLIIKQFDRGIHHLFVYTKPSNEGFFNSLGFYKVEETEQVVLLENIKSGIENFAISLQKSDNINNNIGSIVMNCNPFTKGHRYLIEYASKNCDLLHIFIVEEDRSYFPFDIRYQLVKDGIEDLNNVILHKSGQYIISSTTFPTYFIKDKHKRADVYAELDLKIFAKHIAPTLNITKRFVGKEPFCQVTNQYNGAMKKILPNYNIEVIEIDRIESEGTAISASSVRNHIKNYGVNEKLKELVPLTTYNFLDSVEAKSIIFNIKNSD